MRRRARPAGVNEDQGTYRAEGAARTPPLTFIDLFCGCGGFTLGMLRASFRCLAAIDFNPQAVAALKANLADRCPPGAASVEHALERDLTEFAPSELASLIGTNRLDVIVGGPPCQGFSTARQRDGSNSGTRLKEDPRRHLYRHFLDYVQFFQPRVFVIENVLGIRTAAGGRYFTAVQHEARVLGQDKGGPGYRVHAQIENAIDLGVPQKRRRQLIIGVRADLPGYFPSELQPAREGLATVSLGDAICDLPPLKAGEGSNARLYDFDRRRDFLLSERQDVRRRYLFGVLEVEQAKELTNHTARPHSARDLRDFSLLPEGRSSAGLMRQGVKFEFPYDKTTFKDRYTRQHRHRPCSTIVAHLSKDGLMFIHPTQNRSLTPREAARVQSFPDWFRFPESRTHAFRMIGNAVPPLIAEAVGRAIGEFFAAGATTPPVQVDVSRLEHRFGTVPADMAEAKAQLEILMRLPARGLRELPKADFLRGWHALLFLFPGLHPDNALDHGHDIEGINPRQLPLPGFDQLIAHRYVRSGWPVALQLIGCQAWQRYRAGFFEDEEFYCSEAQAAGMGHQEPSSAGSINEVNVN